MQCCGENIDGKPPLGPSETQRQLRPMTDIQQTVQKNLHKKLASNFDALFSC